MRQKINLLNAFSTPNRPKFDALTLLILLVAFIFILFFIQIKTWLHVRQLDKRQVQLLHIDSKSRVELATLLAQLPETGADQKNKIEALRQGIKSKSTFLDETTYSTYRFSDQMQAIANSSLPGIWLQAFSIDQPNNQISLLGRTTDPTLVPVFLNNLRQEQTFSHFIFKQIKLVKPDDHNQYMAFSIDSVPTEATYIFAEDKHNTAPPFGKGGIA